MRGELLTTRRDKRKAQAKDAERPKLKKETLRDLNVGRQADAVRGGFRRDGGNCTNQDSGCATE